MSTTSTTVPSPKVITILGSTGIQGASVLHYLLQCPESHFHLRAITTRPSPSSSLAAVSSHPNMTVHVLSDTTSKTGLLEIFSGSHVVFGNTNTHDKRYDGKPGSPTEIQALHAIVDAAIEANVELLILSCLPDTGELGHKSSDFLNKLNGMKYAQQKAKETGLKVVYVQLGWYVTNFIGGHDPVVNEVDGVVEFAMKGLKQDKRGK